ncbi:MAG: hypothetical protein WHT09_10930 [Thermogutta sp.]
MSENAHIRRPKSLEEAYELAKNFQEIPTTLTEPSPPPEDLPPEEYQKAWQEYERQVEEYWLQKTYGANYKDNPLYQFREPYLKAEWEAIKDLIL